jgi:hypothetical protein
MNKHYVVLTSPSLDALIDKVNGLSEQGYRPVGNFVVASGSRSALDPRPVPLFMQAVFRAPMVIAPRESPVGYGLPRSKDQATNHRTLENADT